MFPGEALHRSAGAGDVVIFLALLVVPSIAASLLSFTRLFWLLVIPGCWFALLAVELRLEGSEPALWTSVLLCSALAMILSPVVAWALRKSENL